MLQHTLKELRIKNGDTQESISEKLNVPKRTYGSWERGERSMPYDMLVKVANIYDISLDYLLGRNVEDRNDTTAVLSEIQKQNMQEKEKIEDITHRLRRLKGRQVDLIMYAMEIVEKGGEL